MYSHWWKKSASFWGRTWTACSRGQQTGIRHLEQVYVTNRVTADQQSTI